MISDANAHALKTSLVKASLVPGCTPLIPENFTPTVHLEIKYGEKAVKIGNFFRANECKVEPAVGFAAEADLSNSSYTLLLLDPDAPTPDDPKFAYWRHWVLPGLQPLTPTGQDTSASTAPVPAATTKFALTKYLGPGPKDESKPHRYLFLLFREPSGLDLRKEDVGGEEFVERRSFEAVEFIERYGLVLVGLNWMLCVGDGWVEGGDAKA